MKKLIVIFAVLFFIGAFATFVSAQTDPVNSPTQDNKQAQPQTNPSMTTGAGMQQSTPPSQTNQKSKEYIEMKNGKVFRYKDGQSIVVTNSNSRIGNVTFDSDGIVTLRDGSKINLREGDIVTGDGRVIRSTERARINPSNDTEKY